MGQKNDAEKRGNPPLLLFSARFLNNIDLNIHGISDI